MYDGQQQYAFHLLITTSFVRVTSYLTFYVLLWVNTDLCYSALAQSINLRVRTATHEQGHDRHELQVRHLGGWQLGRLRSTGGAVGLLPRQFQNLAELARDDADARAHASQFVERGVAEGELAIISSEPVRSDI